MSESLDERVAEFLHLYSTQSTPLRWGVAVSGGADSVVLLHILHRLSPDIVVLHVNHGLRGFDSQNDELFVRELATLLRCPIEVQQGPPAVGNLEAEARRIRHDFFRRVRQEQNLNFVALGHTASDQAETVLFRLFRGSGLKGLGAMSPASGGLIRPFLTSTRGEVRSYAQSHHIAWREDKSNSDMHFRRNWLRFAIIPELVRKLNPRLEETLSTAAEIARDEEAWWSQKIGRVLRNISSPFRRGPDLVVDASRLGRLHPAIQRRVIRAALDHVRGHMRSLDASHIQAIRKLAATKTGHGRLQVPGADIIRSFESILFARPETMKIARDYSFEIAINSEVSLPFGLGTFSVNPVTSELQICANVKEEELLTAEEAELDDDALGFHGATLPVKIRNWQPGDSILLPGSEHPVKLKTLFQESRIVLWERRHWPVLVVGNEIAWTRRFGIAARFMATAGKSNVCRLRYFPSGGSGEL